MSEEPGFYCRLGKRLVDVGVSLIALVIVSPLLFLCAVLIKRSSPGPAFYRQERVGRGGRVFQILKLRTMFVDEDGRGARLASYETGRITPLGAWLRRLKIDELPQMWNVLRGEMSLVGPRPELAAYVASYTPEQRRVLTVRPGLTDPASLSYRNEEDLLRASADPEQLYWNEILPRKLALNLAYIDRISFSCDLRLVFQTLRSVFFPFASKKTDLE